MGWGITKLFLAASLVVGGGRVLCLNREAVMTHCRHSGKAIACQSHIKILLVLLLLVPFVAEHSRVLTSVSAGPHPEQAFTAGSEESQPELELTAGGQGSPEPKLEPTAGSQGSPGAESRDACRPRSGRRLGLAAELPKSV